jgi:hypothetical protein
MTAYEDAQRIVGMWKNCAPVLSKMSAWMALLHIAAAGPEGIWHSQMKQHLYVVPRNPTLRCWQRAGLIRVDKLPCKRRRLVIEDKGLRLLRLKMKAN